MLIKVTGDYLLRVFSIGCPDVFVPNGVHRDNRFVSLASNAFTTAVSVTILNHGDDLIEQSASCIAFRIPQRGKFAIRKSVKGDGGQIEFSSIMCA